MARVAIPITVIDAAGNAKSGASVTVKKRSDNSNAVLYQAETGATTTPNPTSTDANGRVTAWADRNAYICNVTGSGITAYSEQFDATPAGDATVDAQWLATSVLPFGSIMAYAGSADPSGGAWLICDGRALGRTAYASLYSIIGTTFGVGDGTTTFNVPNLRGRSPLGVGLATGATGATTHTLGQVGGEETHTLTAGESGVNGNGGMGGMNANAVHSHLSAQNSGFIIPGGNPSDYNSGPAYSGGTAWNVVSTDSKNLDHGHALTARNADASHNTMHPYLGVNFIIRAA